MEQMPPHQQAELFLRSGGIIRDGSLTSRVLQARTLAEDALSQLQRWNAGAPHPERDPLNSIFHAARLFGPYYILKDLAKSPLLAAYVQQGLNEHPEIEVAQSPRDFVRLLHRWSKKTGAGALSSICTAAVKHHVVLGIVELVGERYASAKVHFEWAHRVLAKTSAKFAAISDENDYLCPGSRMLVALWLCQCHMQGSLEADSLYLGTLLTDLVVFSTTQTNCAFEHLHGRLGPFFAACGFLYEHAAARDGYSVLVEEEGALATLAYKYDKVNTWEMTRKYVVAATALPLDDPMRALLYEKVVLGILLHGGIHMKVLWFFMVLHNQCLLGQDYGPIHVLPGVHQYRLFAKEAVLGQYENGWAVVMRILDLCVALEGHDVWDPARAADYLLPQVFCMASRLVVADHFYNEHSAYTNTRAFVRVLEFQVRPKIRAQLKLPQFVVDRSLLLSRDLVEVWAASHETYHDVIPKEVDAALRSFGQW